MPKLDLETIVANMQKEQLRRSEVFQIRMLELKAERCYRRGLVHLFRTWGSEIPEEETRKLKRFCTCRILLHTGRCLVCKQKLDFDHISGISPYCAERLKELTGVDAAETTPGELFRAVAEMSVIDNRIFVEEVTDAFVHWSEAVRYAKHAGISEKKLAELSGGHGPHRLDPVDPIYQVYYHGRKRYVHRDLLKHLGNLAMQVRESGLMEDFREEAKELLNPQNAQEGQ